MATPSPKNAAKAIVHAFVTGPKAGVWPAIEKGKLAAQIEARIDDPNVINQKSTPLCGPATTIRAFAMDDPEAYARAIIALYTAGTAQIGQLAIDASVSLRAIAPAGGTEAADWILAASIRDSENYVFAVVEGWRGKVAGMTLPGEVFSWFEDLGYTEILDRSHLVARPSHTALRTEAAESSHLYESGYRVCILVDGDVMRQEEQDDFFSLFPTHWIGLASPITFSSGSGRDETLSFQCYSWGSLRSVPENLGKPLKTEDFLNKYYGYIAARY